MTFYMITGSHFCTIYVQHFLMTTVVCYLHRLTDPHFTYLYIYIQGSHIDVLLQCVHNYLSDGFLYIYDCRFDQSSSQRELIHIRLRALTGFLPGWGHCHAPDRGSLIIRELFSSLLIRNFLSSGLGRVLGLWPSPLLYYSPLREREREGTLGAHLGLVFTLNFSSLILGV